MNNVKQKLVDEIVLSKGNKYSWAFYSKFDNIESFINEFKLYNKEIGDLIVDDFIVFTGDKIIIHYSGALPDKDYQSLKYIIDAKVNQNISYLDLMYQFNNGAYEFLHDVDHHFFEGLNYEDLQGETLILTMSLGS